MGCSRIPADLAHVVRPHVRAQRGGQQLRAQADAEDGNVALQRFLDGGDLGGQMRKVIRLVHVHRAAEHDEAVVAADVRLLLRLAREIDVADAEAVPAQHGVEQSEGFAGGVLEDEELAHRCGN